MKMAKASERDLDMSMELCNALESISDRWGPSMPEKILLDATDSERFDIDDPKQCRSVLEYLLNLTRSASLGRVVFGMAVLLDPANKIVDPNADTLEHYPVATLPAGE